MTELEGEIVSAHVGYPTPGGGCGLRIGLG